MKRGRGRELSILVAGRTRGRPRLKPRPQESLRSALQASPAPATPRDEDLEREGDEEEEEEDEDEDEDEDDSLTSASQVSCLLVWGSVNQAGVPQRGGVGSAPAVAEIPCWQGSSPVVPRPSPSCEPGQGHGKQMALSSLKPRGYGSAVLSLTLPRPLS